MECTARWLMLFRGNLPKLKNVTPRNTYRIRKWLFSIERSKKHFLTLEETINTKTAGQRTGIKNNSIFRQQRWAEIHCIRQKQPPEVFCKKRVLKNFTKFTGKHLCQSLFLIKLKTFLKKEALTQVFSCKFCEIFKYTFFTEDLRVPACF